MGNTIDRRIPPPPPGGLIVEEDPGTGFDEVFNIMQNQPAPMPNADISTPGPQITQLNPQQQQQFQQWVTQNKIPYDPSPQADYDMPGYWLASQSGDPEAKTVVSEFDGKPHFPDTHKTRFHKTFSQDSKYALPGKAPQWQGNKLIARDGRVIADETPAQEANPFDSVFQLMQPTQSPELEAQPMPLAQTVQPQPVVPQGGGIGPMGPPGPMPGGQMGPIGPQGQAPAPPQMVTLHRSQPKQQPPERKQALKPPSGLQELAAHLLMAGDHTAAGIVHGIKMMDDRAAGKLAKSVLEAGQQRAEEAHKHGPFSVGEAHATVAGLVHGPAQFAQDMYNGLVAAPFHGQPANFADQLMTLPGMKSAAENHPGSFGTASAGGGMAVPLGGAGAAAKGIGKAILHGAGTGAVLGGVGNVGQQYKEKGKVDAGEVLDNAATTAALGTVAAAGGHAISKVASKPHTPPESVHETGGPKQPEGTRQTQGHTRKDYAFIDKDVKGRLVERDNAETPSQPGGDIAQPELMKDAGGPHILQLHKKIIGGKEVRLDHWKNEEFKQAQQEYAAKKQLIEEMYGDDDVLKRKELAAAAEEHYKNIKEKFGSDTKSGDAAGGELGAKDASAGGAKTKAQTDYTSMSDSELDSLSDEHNLTLKKAEKGLSLPRGAAVAAERESKAIGAEKFRRALEAHKANLASSQTENLQKIEPETPAAQEENIPLEQKSPTTEELYANDLDHHELKKYPNHRDDFNDWERKDGKNIKVRSWSPNNVPDWHLDQHIEILENTKKENGKLGDRQTRELDASLQEKARRAERIANGHEPNWPMEKAPEPKPEYKPPEDYTKLSDDELADHFTKGTDEHQMNVANEVLRRHAPAPEPTPEPIKEYTFRKASNGKGYEILDPDGKVHSRPREKADDVQTRVDKLNSGELSPTRGAKDSYKTSERQGEEQLKIAADARELENATTEQVLALDALAGAKHAHDEARARYNATYDAWLKSQPPEMVKTKPKTVFKYDRAAEVQVMNEMPELVGYEVQSSRKITGEYTQSKAKGPKDLGNQVVADHKAFKASKAAYDDARKAALDAIGDHSEPLLIKHPKGDITFRKIPRANTDAMKRLHKITEPGTQTEIKRNIEPVEDWLGDLGKMVKDAYKPNGISQVTLPGINQVMSAAKRVKAKYGMQTDARVTNKLLMNELNSDIYARTADPEFNHERQLLNGRMDLNFQGVEKLHTQEQKDAWQKNRYSKAADILAGKNDADQLTPAQRHALVGQNDILNDMADLHEQYHEHLKAQGFDGEGLKAMVPGQNELAATLKTDLADLDRSQYGPKGTQGMLDEAGKKVTSGIYDMYVTGNWPIHQLHAIEAASVGSAYHPAAFSKAVTGLASNGDVRKFVSSFDSSSGNMKAIREDSDTVLGKHWRAMQALAVGGKANAQALANNKAVQLAGDVLEGSIAEKAKLHLIRAQSAHIAAEEMNYPGGGNKLMADMNNPASMKPETRLEAASKIVYHMNQMIGYSPSGLKDLNVFGRLGKANPLVRWFTPFTTTRIQQSRVLTKFFTNAVHAGLQGDYQKAAAGVGQGLLMLGTIAMIGGRAAVPRELQDALHYADPEMAKEFLERMDGANYIGHLLNTEVEHVTPSLMVPAFLGDSFPVQLLKSMDDAAFAKDMPQWRGAATLLASLGIASIGDKLGFSSILKLVKAYNEGTAGEYKQYAGGLNNTLTTAAKTFTPLGKMTEHMGMPTKGILGAKIIKTNLPERLGHVVKTGVNLTAAEFVNKTRDDDAFGDAINRFNPKLYKKLQAQNSRLSKAYAAAPAENRENMEHLQEGFWERAFKHYVRQKNQERLQLAQGDIEA